MEISLLQPLWLLGLLALPLLWYWPRRKGGAAVRALLFALLLLALARPVGVWSSSEEHHVFVVDVSASVDASARGDATARVEAWRSSLAGAKTTVIDWDAPVSALLAEAERTIPEGASGAVTLLTDGLATDRRWGPAVQRLTARGLPVHTVALAPKRLGVRPVAVEPQGTLRVGHTARIVVTLAGRGAVDASLRGPAEILARAANVAVDGRATLLLEFEPAAAGFLPLTVEAGGVTLTRTVAVQDPLRVLYLGERMAGGGDKLAALVGKGFRFESAPELPDDLSAYDLVVADDIPASSLPEADQQRIASAVTDDGLGFVMAGGTSSFGPGGYHKLPLADILPVDFMQKEEKRDPSTTLVVIIDTSGSMSGTRVQLAKEVARLAMRRLLPHDKVGIVEFYGAKRWAAPIQPASNSIEIQRALNRLNAGGGTVIMPAIEEAYYGLQNVQTRYKHVLVLTDGGVESGAFEPLLRNMARKGVNVSTVLVGASAHSEFLVSIARWGKGRFYSVPNRFNLPEVILKQPTTARLPAYRRGVHEVQARGGAGWWGRARVASVPPLAGYVEARARDGADVLLETKRGAHPVLASWRHGLGRVTAMLTEPTGPGTAPWRDWRDYGAGLARVLARTAREPDASWSFALRRDDAVLTVVARRNAPGAVLPAVRADGPLVLRERADGLFETRVAWPPRKEARVLAGDVRLVSPAFEGVSPELQVDPAGALDLALLAAQTGGEAEVGAPTAARGKDPLAARELAPLLLLLALLVYLLDIATRRWPRKEATA